jgi:peptide/nickel transport system substrate-binding protein
MGRQWRSLRILLIGSACLLAPARLVHAGEGQEAPTVLRIAVSGLPSSLFPIRSRTAEMSYVRGFIGRSLTIYDKSWAVACSLCTELPTLQNGRARIVTREDGSKGIDVTFDLDPDLAWDDGVPVTTADVLLGIEVARKVGAADLTGLLDAVALDDHRFTLRVAGVRFDYNHKENLYLLPAHRERAIYEAAAGPAEYRSRSLYVTDPTAPGLSYGPYKIAHLGPKEIILERNSHWPGKMPSFERIELREFDDAASAGADLAAGRIDMVAGEIGGLDVEGVYQLEAEDKRSAYEFLYKPTLVYQHIDINLANDLLQDKRLRKALLLSLDRPIATEGHGPRSAGDPPRSFLPPTSPNFDPTLSLTPYDPVQAAALLDAAGYRRGADGVRVDPRGRRLAFRLAAQLEATVNRRTVDHIKDQWREAGIEITLENAPAMSEILPRRDFDLAFYDWVNLPEFPLEPVYGKSGIPSAENGYRGSNFPGFDNAEMNKVVAALATELDPSRRLLLWRRAQQIYAEELPALPLAFLTEVYILPATMTGVEPTGHMIPTSFWVEDWKLR